MNLLFTLLLVVGLRGLYSADETGADTSYKDIYPSNVSGHGGRVPLYFGLMMSFGGEVKSSGAVPGVQVALDVINSQSDLLPGYTLHYTLTDSQCKRKNALGGLYTQLFEPPGSKLALIGSGCSLATKATAELSHYYNLPQISCVSSSNELNDRQRFQNYLQLLPTEAEIVPIFFAIIKEYGWRKVAIIVQREDRFTTAMRNLKDLLSQANVNYTERAIKTQVDISRLEESPFDAESRIFVFAMSARPARQLLCKAHALGMKYPKHLFLTYGTYESHWWVPPEDEDVDHLCSPEDRARVLEFSFAALHLNFLVDGYKDTVTGSEFTAEMFKHKYTGQLNMAPFYYSYSDYAPHCYDATWTLAIALNKTIGDPRVNMSSYDFINAFYGGKTKMSLSKDDFYESSAALNAVMMEYLYSTDFVGLSGPVHFNANGIRSVIKLRVLQYRSNKSDSVSLSQRLSALDVAYITEDLQFQYKEDWDASSVWPVAVPYDGVPKEVIDTVALPVTVLFAFLAITGLLFASICLVFICVFRNKKLIRLSSPNLNYLILTGAACFFVSALLYVIPAATPEIMVGACIVGTWLNSVGYSLEIGSIVVKAWRVYYIFRNPKKADGLHDKYLICFVLVVLFAVDTPLLILFTILEGVFTGFDVAVVTSKENPVTTQGDLAVTAHHFLYTCSAKPVIRSVMLSVLFGYKVLLQLCALYFAFQTRKIKWKGLNDAKYITSLVYISSIILAITLIAGFGLRRYINLYAIIFATCVYFGTMALLGLVFIPKMITLYKDPQGESVMTVHEALIREGKVTTQQNDETCSNLRKKIQGLELTISRYKSCSRLLGPLEEETEYGSPAVGATRTRSNTTTEKRRVSFSTQTYFVNHSASLGTLNDN